MAVCQYFLRGQCKFGDNCRNEHPRDGQRQSAFGSLELNFLVIVDQTWNSANAPTTSQLFTVESMTKDLDPKLEKPLWPLSSYGPAKFQPNVISGLDESFEELRVKAVIARNTNTVDGYMKYEAERIAAAEQVFANARSNIQQVHSQAVRALTSNTSVSAFGAPTNAISAPQSAFASISTSSAPKSAFGQSAFGQPAFGQSAFGTASGTTSAFGAPSQGTSAFGQASGSISAFGQPAAGTSAFGQPAQGTSAFGQSSLVGSGTSAFGQPTSAFGQATQPTSAFGQTAQPTSAFGQTTQPTSAFGQPSQPTSAFGQTTQRTSAFGQPSQPTSAFGQTSQPSSFIKPATGAFGGGTTGGAFSAFANPPASSSGGGAFSAFAGTPSAFGTNAAASTSAFANPPAAGTSTFGQSSFGNPSAAPKSAFASSSPFGQQTQTQTPTSTSTPATTSAFGTPQAPVSAFGALSKPVSAFASPAPSQPASSPAQPISAFSQASTAQSTSAFGTGAATNAFGAGAHPSHAPKERSGKPDFAAALRKALYVPGLNKYDELLPENYITLLPGAVVAAFKGEKFDWGNVPEWVPPKELR